MISPLQRGLFVYTMLMGKHIHKLSNVDLETKTGDCSFCGQVSLRVTRCNKERPILRCKVAHKISKKTRERPWALYKKDICDRCGFVPESMTQLDVDHIDGDRSNNTQENLQTLCANCHRLKTEVNKNSFNLKYR